MHAFAAEDRQRPEEGVRREGRVDVKIAEQDALGALAARRRDRRVALRADVGRSRLADDLAGATGVAEPVPEYRAAHIERAERDDRTAAPIQRNMPHRIPRVL